MVTSSIIRSLGKVSSMNIVFHLEMSHFSQICHISVKYVTFQSNMSYFSQICHISVKYVIFTVSVKYYILHSEKYPKNKCRITFRRIFTLISERVKYIFKACPEYMLHIAHGMHTHFPDRVFVFNYICMLGNATYQFKMSTVICYIYIYIYTYFKLTLNRNIHTM